MRGCPVVLVLALSGCSSVLGISDLTGPGSDPVTRPDGGFDGDAGDTVPPYDVTGKTVLVDPMSATQTPVAAEIDLLGLGNETIASGVARADGAFTLHVGDGRIGSALHAHSDPSMGTVDAYTLFSDPLIATTDAGPVSTVTAANLVQLEQIYFEASSATGTVTLVTAKNADGKPIAGVSLMVTDFNATVRYLSPAGVPDGSLRSTSASGQAAVYHPKAATAVYIAMGAVNATTGAVSIAPSSLYTLTLQAAF